MGELVDFKTKEILSETFDGAELETLSRNTLLNVFFPAKTDWETIVVRTSINDICNVIKSEVHQMAVWHAVCQLDQIRKMYPGAAGAGGKFGSPERLVDVQLGLVNPDD